MNISSAICYNFWFTSFSVFKEQLWEGAKTTFPHTVGLWSCRAVEEGKLVSIIGVYLE